MTEVSTIGLDLAKNVFQVHGVDVSGETVIRPKECLPAHLVAASASAAHCPCFVPGIFCGSGSLRLRRLLPSAVLVVEARVLEWRST